MVSTFESRIRSPNTTNQTQESSGLVVQTWHVGFCWWDTRPHLIWRCFTSIFVCTWQTCWIRHREAQLSTTQCHSYHNWNSVPLGWMVRVCYAHSKIHGSPFRKDSNIHLSFNAGSALSANMRAIMAALVTNLSACVGGLTWCLMDYRFEGKWSVVGFCSGVVAGLVAITPASGYVAPWAAVLIGIAAGTFQKNSESRAHMLTHGF